MDHSLFETKEYKRSRKGYVSFSAFNYFVSILAGDVYLSTLLTHVGLEDSLIGIISSVISLAFVFQLLTLLLVGRVSNTKKTVITITACSHLLFMAMFLIPFIPVSLTAKTILVISFLLLAYLCSYLVAPLLTKWANNYVEPGRRAEFSAGNEMISLASGIVFTLIVGHIVDRFKGLDNLTGAFLFIASAILILVVCNFASLSMIQKDTEGGRQGRWISLKDAFVHTLKNRNYVNVVIMSCLWDISRYLVLGFMATFKTKELLLSVGTVQVVNMVGNLARFAVSRPFGRYSDRNSYVKGVKLAMMLTMVAHLANMFTTPKTRWLIVVFTVFDCVGLAGTNSNAFNILYNYVDNKYIVQATALKNSISGVCGFTASLLAGRILQLVQENGNMVLGIPMYGQQLLSGISCMVLVICIIFIKRVIEKQEIIGR